MDKLIFKKGNKIKYMQDMQIKYGIPSDIAFDSSPHDLTNTFLIADGYGYGITGRPNGKYGDGRILVENDELNKFPDDYEILYDTIPIVLNMEESATHLPILTNDDKYEIEKILDIYAGMLNDTLCKFCNISINYEAIHKDKSPLAKGILEIGHSIKRIKEIRDKLQKLRQ